MLIISHDLAAGAIFKYNAIKRSRKIGPFFVSHSGGKNS